MLTHPLDVDLDVMVAIMVMVRMDMGDHILIVDKNLLVMYIREPLSTNEWRLFLFGSFAFGEMLPTKPTQRFEP